MKMHTNRHQEAKLLPPDTFLSRKNAFAAGPRWGSLQGPPGRWGKRRGGEGWGGEKWEWKGKGYNPEQKSWLRPCVRVCSTSVKMVPFESLGMVSYLHFRDKARYREVKYRFMTSLTRAEMSGLWAPRLIVVYILSINSSSQPLRVSKSTLKWVGDFKYGTSDDNIYTAPQLPPQISKFCITLQQKLVCFLKYDVPVLTCGWYKVDRKRGHNKSGGRLR